MSISTLRRSTNFRLTTAPDPEGSAGRRSFDIDNLAAVNIDGYGTVNSTGVAVQAPENIRTALTSRALDARTEHLEALLSIPAHVATVEDIGVTLQDWEGYVEEVGDLSFKARLLDRTKRNSVDTEIADIPLRHVREGDLELLFKGSTFYLFIRRRIDPEGTEKHSVKLSFRRLPAWTAAELDRIKVKAAEKAARFKQRGD